ncbi:hypothetical protein Bbelb_108440 [Branchiostoma belcheri]|nr:hypothetical protein Bbelb_108440 [Branchiostoma belcheri]
MFPYYVLFLFLLAGAETLETRGRPSSCTPCHQSSSAPENVINCVQGCAAVTTDSCLGSPFLSHTATSTAPSAPRELQVRAVDSGNGQGGEQDNGAVRITWQPGADGLESVRGFEVQLIELSMQQTHSADGWSYLTLKFQVVVSGLYREEDYDVMVWSLPKQQDGGRNNFVQQTFEHEARSCPQQRKAAKNWHPKKPDVTTVGRQISVRAKTTRTARLNCINQYVLYLGTPTDSPAYPKILKPIYINLTPDGVAKTYFHYTFSDVPPGNYTIQYAVSIGDAVRSYPVQVTVKDWAPNNVTVHTNGRNATVRFDAPPQTYNLSTCHVRLFLHDELQETIVKHVDPNQSVVTVNFRDLPPDTYRLAVSAPFDDASPVYETEFSITDWVPHQNDTKLHVTEETANSTHWVPHQNDTKLHVTEETPNTTRVTVTFPRPPHSHDYPSFYVFYGNQTDTGKLKYKEIAKPLDDKKKNITVQLDVAKGRDIFFQVSAPYKSARRSDLKHFQIPVPAVSQQTWFLGVTAGVGGGLVLALLLMVMYIKRLAKKKSTSFTDIVKGLISRPTRPGQLPKITEPCFIQDHVQARFWTVHAYPEMCLEQIYVLGYPQTIQNLTCTSQSPGDLHQKPPCHGGPNGAVHQFANFLHTGLYCDVTTELTSQREVDLVGPAQWYIDKMQAADYTVVVCPPSNNATGTDDETEPDAMFTHCVRILGEKLTTDPATQHHKCLTVRFEYSGKQAIPQVLCTVGHYKINARDPDFEDTMLNLFCHFHKFERYRLQPESWTIRLGEQDNAAKACRRDLQTVLSQNAALLGRQGAAGGGLEQGGGGTGQGGGVRADPGVPNTPDQLPHGSSLESLMEREGETPDEGFGLPVNDWVDGEYDHISALPTAYMYSANACSADVTVLGAQGAEGVTSITMEGLGGSNGEYGHLCRFNTAYSYSTGICSADASVLHAQGAEGVTRISMEGDGGSVADAPTARPQAGPNHVVSMGPTHSGTGYVENIEMGVMHSSEVDDLRDIPRQHCNDRKIGQTAYKTPDQIPQEENMEFDMTAHREGLACQGIKKPGGHLPASLAHDTGYHSSPNNSEQVVRPKFPPRQFRHYPYAGHSPPSLRRPLPGTVAQSRRQIDTLHTDRTHGRLHLDAREQMLQADEMMEASLCNAASSNLASSMSANFCPASPHPSAGPRSGSAYPPAGSRAPSAGPSAVLPLPPAERPPQSPPPTSNNVNIEDMLSLLNSLTTQVYGQGE